MQRAALDELERDQQSADAAVAVQEWVDRLELRVGDSAVHERRQRIAVVQEALEMAQRVNHVGHRRWNERRIRERRSLRPDPVLRSSNVAGRGVSAAHVPHELGVDHLDESQRQRQSLELLDPGVHRPDVVEDFTSVVDLRAKLSSLEGKDIGQGAVCSLDL